MIIARIEGATRVLGQSQGFLGLPIRDEVVGDAPCMVSAWEPTPEEIKRLNAGEKVYLSVMGSSHPPVMLGIGK